MKSITIALGEKSFEVKELTVGQIEQIHEVLNAARAANHTRAATNREIIAAALAVDHPEMTAEALKSVRVPNIQELATASDKVLEFGGWVITEKGAAPAQESKPGEAPAG